MTKKSNTIQRDSGIELLRIFAACAVVVLHYCNTQMGGALAVVSGTRKIFLDLLLCFCCCAVNVFVLISGYFMSSKQTCSLGKPFSLWLQVVLFSLMGYGLVLYLKEGSFNPMTIAFILVPHNYFVVLYTALYLLSPLINKFLLSLNKNQYFKLLVISLFLFSVYNSGIDLLHDLSGREMTGRNTIGIYGTQDGYTIVNFVLVYSIGGYLRRFGFSQLLEKLRIPIAIICVLCIFGLRCLVHGGPSATSYLNPFVILLAVCLLCIFKDFTFKNVIINELAGAAFTCFLFHLIIISRIGVKTYAAGPSFLFILHLFLSVVIIYVVSYMLYKIYNFVFSWLINLIDKFHLSYDDSVSIIKR